jgi:hypothetical protein
VTLTPHIGAGWADSIHQCETLDEFLAALVGGTFDFTFAD